MIRRRLEELSLESLFRIAARNDLDVEPEIGRQELVDRLVDAILEKREELEKANNTTVRVEQTKFSLVLDDEAPGPIHSLEEFDLPEQYDDVRIALMLRDPNWAYTYWDISRAKRAEYASSSRFDGLFLRVLELEDASLKEIHIRDSFEIPVQLTDRSWYIFIPRDEAWYRIQLVARNHHRRELLAVSNQLYVPRAQLPEAKDGPTEAMLRLCGVDHLAIATQLPERERQISVEES